MAKVWFLIKISEKSEITNKMYTAEMTITSVYIMTWFLKPYNEKLDIVRSMSRIKFDLVLINVFSLTSVIVFCNIPVQQTFSVSKASLCTFPGNAQNREKSDLLTLSFM